MLKERIVCKTNEEFWKVIEPYWDYEKNEKHWSEYTKGAHKKVWIKCLETDYHESYEISCSHFSEGKRCPCCVGQKVHPRDSFAQYNIDNINKDFLEKYWDWDKNNELGNNPWNITVMSTKDVFIFCQDNSYHDSYKIEPRHFSKGCRCPFCAGKQVHPKDSLAQWSIDNLGEDFLDKYWSDKNTLNPWKISLGSDKKIWIKCQNKDYHEDYIVAWWNFKNGTRCPCCSHNVFNEGDSLGSLLKEINLSYIYSDKNKKSAHDVSPSSTEICWFKCPDGKHDDFERSTNGSKHRDFRCPICSTESKIGEGNCRWNGGVSTLSQYLRSNILQWKKDSIKESYYKCILSGSRFNVVHHLYGFDKIIQETLSITNLPIYTEMNMYTEIESALLVDTCTKLHAKYGLGVCLSNEVHDRFHLEYGYGKNTPEQFEEFKQNYKQQLNNNLVS